MASEEIPDDVMEAARMVMKEWCGTPDLVQRFARAILAERERCAKVAEAAKPEIVVTSPARWVEVFNDWGEPCGKIKEGIMTRKDYNKGIAAAIRNPDTKPQ